MSGDMHVRAEMCRCMEHMSGRTHEGRDVWVYGGTCQSTHMRTETCGSMGVRIRAHERAENKFQDVVISPLPTESPSLLLLFPFLPLLFFPPLLPILFFRYI